MQMIGRKTRSVFERYNIVSECDLVDAVKKLNTLQPVPPASNRDRHNSGTVSRFLRNYWRRRPDLNRGWRFCRPLPYHLATAPLLVIRGTQKNPRRRALRREEVGAGNGIRTRDFDLGKVALYH
jgi:hypothetical protein